MPVMQVWGQAKVRVKRMMIRMGRRIKRNVAYFQKWQQISLERGSFNI
ncbi:CLUMA_CG018993, isoform A [Clunio marinus]|uniref:CLUMA_CG018993, isoform A n=1 Tax=Clunio marinus TaxID=568069 RepID=A0A1J1J2F6_9DIPT|nr:CLUMA_CG018993, isoform A [Clunio marinus]